MRTSFGDPKDSVWMQILKHRRPDGEIIYQCNYQIENPISSIDSLMSITVVPDPGDYHEIGIVQHY